MKNINRISKKKLSVEGEAVEVNDDIATDTSGNFLVQYDGFIWGSMEDVLDTVQM